MIRMNQPMKDYLASIGLNDFHEFQRLSMKDYLASIGLNDFREFQKLFSLELVDECGCVVLKERFRNPGYFKSPDDIKRVHQDLTAFEWCVNEIYFNQHYFGVLADHPDAFQTTARIAFALCCALTERLERCFSKKSFQIALSFDIHEPGDDVGDSATIHFTAKHEGETSYIDINDMESCQPVLVYETD